MKIAKINHDRCQEWDGCSYVWVSDDMTKGILSDLILAAVKSLLKAEDDLQKSPQKPMFPGYTPNYDLYPDNTVSEAKVIHEALAKKYQAWKLLETESRKSFVEHLISISGGSIKDFYDLPDNTLRGEASWGHRHGTVILYGETKVNQDPNGSDEDY